MLPPEYERLLKRFDKLTREAMQDYRARGVPPEEINADDLLRYAIDHLTPEERAIIESERGGRYLP